MAESSTRACDSTWDNWRSAIDGLQEKKRRGVLLKRSKCIALHLLAYKILLSPPLQLMFLS